MSSATSTAERPGGHVSCLGCTHRSDAWQVGPAATFLGLLLFIVYSTWAAFQNEHYLYENYLSPFYSPVLVTQTVDAAGNAIAGAAPATGHVHAAWFGQKPAAWPAWLPFSPALLILVFPGVFRFTCYYYRKAYYRSFWGNPPGCAVGPFLRGKYRGETHLLLFQNLHRYAMYFALAFIVILAYDAVMGFFRGGRFGVGVGSLVLLVNVTLLASYTFGCHSLRHLVGGRLNWFSRSRLGYWLWKRSTFLNERHMMLAWMSLFWVGFSDVYVRLVSMGVVTDISTWG